jgi:hypothetical protein
MRGTSRRLAVALGVSVALTLSGIVSSSAAPQRTNEHEPPAHSAHAKVHQQGNSTQPSNGNDAATNSLPGYSAQPQGQCWIRQGGGGHDLSGHWEACGSSH